MLLIIFAFMEETIKIISLKHYYYLFETGGEPQIAALDQSNL